MAQDDPKTLIDMGLGTAITGSFAIPEVGPGIAAALSGAKFIFDVFYPADKSGVDPLSRIPTEADLQNAVSDIEASVAKLIWDNTKGASQDQVIQDSKDWANALKNAGATKTPSDPMPGDTTVWNNGVVIKKFDPANDSPSPLMLVADTVERKASEKYATTGLYTLTVGVYLNFCKLGMAWEFNENLKDYNRRLATWTKLNSAHNFWVSTGSSGPEPEKPGPKPTPPVDGDYAVGSEVIDAKTGVIRDYRSYLGKAKGQNISHFVTLAKNEMESRTKYLKSVTADWQTARNDRDTYIQGYLDKVTITTVSVNGAVQYQWVNGVTGDKGDPVAIRAMAEAQLAVEQAKLRGTYEEKWAAKNTDPDVLEQTDIDKLNKTADAWQASVDALSGVTPKITPKTSTPI